MRLGYSFWGFLYDGIADTPDGGRIHRLAFLKALIGKGVSVICLQANRDRNEAGQSTPVSGLSFAEGFPQLDALLCEYRWPIAGRNTPADRGREVYTSDLARQAELLAHYGHVIPTILWDKDLKLDPDHRVEWLVAEAALHTRPGRFRLLFAFDDAIKDRCLANLANYSHHARPIDLLYIGNQYERDSSFEKYINNVGKVTCRKPQVYGNWTKYRDRHEQNMSRYPDVQFRDRLAYCDIARTYDTGFSTVLIAPERYYAHGQITQRIFEALSRHVLTFVPAEYQHVGSAVVEELVVRDAGDIVAKTLDLRRKGDQYIRKLIAEQVGKLDAYAPALQANALLTAIGTIKHDPSQAV